MGKIPVCHFTGSLENSCNITRYLVSQCKKDQQKDNKSKDEQDDNQLYFDTYPKNSVKNIRFTQHTFSGCLDTTVVKHIVIIACMNIHIIQAIITDQYARTDTQKQYGQIRQYRRQQADACIHHDTHSETFCKFNLQSCIPLPRLF